MWWSGGKVLKFGIPSTCVGSLLLAGHDSGSECTRRHFFKAFHDSDWKRFLFFFHLVAFWIDIDMKHSGGGGGGGY